jgi:hypothetical protein
VDERGDEVMRKPNSYCHNALGVSKYLSNDPDWYRCWWDYVTALRGYDNDIGNGSDNIRSDAVKGLLTCVIRGKGYNHDCQGLIAWDITFALDPEGYFNVFGDEDERDQLVRYLERDELEHYRHHVAMGFGSLSFYYKRLYDNSGDDVHYLCGKILGDVSDSLTCFNDGVDVDVFNYVYNFLTLISDEVEE